MKILLLLVSSECADDRRCGVAAVTDPGGAQVVAVQAAGGRKSPGNGGRCTPEWVREWQGEKKAPPLTINL
jgi:hypothetical protein